MDNRPEPNLQPEKKKRPLWPLSGLKKTLPFAGGVIATLLALLLYRLAFPAPQPLSDSALEETIAEALASATAPPSFASRIYDTIKFSLVLIETSTDSGEDEPDLGIGSGVVIDFNGDILTSLHVVAERDDIWVTYADGTRSRAQIIFEQPENDIAVLQPTEAAAVVPPAILGNPNALEVGDEAFVVGSPFGLYSSLSAGVISGFERTFRVPESDTRLFGLIQVDAAVNPGNSGGPLVNRDGHVVGIVTGIVNPTEQSFFVGIGFAVPIDVAVGGFGAPPH